jgi:hypothetical protein
MAAVQGICHLCGSFGQLSFEHVPPASAFNDRKVIIPNGRKVFALADLDQLDELGGKQQQRGQGGYTLCPSCNNNTGGWYGSAYADWVYQAANYVSRQGASALAYPFHILPLRVLKQIACMFFSLNPPSFQHRHPELVRFVLNRDEKYLPPKLQFYAGYLNFGRARRAALSSSLNTTEGIDGARIYSELSFFPLSYILSVDGKQPKHAMLNITPFQHNAYHDFRTLHLQIPTVSVYTPFPGDFRPREQVLQESGDAHNSIERTCSGGLRPPTHAAHVKR